MSIEYLDREKLLGLVRDWIFGAMPDKKLDQVDKELESIGFDIDALHNVIQNLVEISVDYFLSTRKEGK